MEGICIWNIFKKSILPATQDLNKYNLIKKTPQFSFCSLEYSITQLYLVKNHSRRLEPQFTGHKGTKTIEYEKKDVFSSEILK